MAARNAVVIALLLAACFVTLVSSHSNGDRQLLAVQAGGNPQTPNKPSAISRKEWGPKFTAATGDRKLMEVQAFIAPKEPAKPKAIDGKRFTVTTGNRHLLQGLNVQTPNKPSAIKRTEWGPKFSAATGNRKLMELQAFIAPKEPAKPKAIDGKRFTVAPTTGNRHLLQSLNVQTPNKPSAIKRTEWGPKFTAATGNRKL